MNRLAPSLKLALCAFALPALWVFADLYLRAELPGAALLAHLAFRALVAPLEWLTEGDGMRLQLALGIWVVAGLSTLRLPQARPLFLALTALAVVAAQLVFIALAVLMERALAAGLLVAIVTLVVSGLVPRDSTGSSQSRRALVLAAVVLGGGAALYYLYAMFMTWGSGYAALEALGALVRTTGVPPVLVYVIVLGASAMAALALVVSRLPEAAESSSMRRLVFAYLLGVTAAMLLWLVFADPGPGWGLLMALPVVTAGAIFWMAFAGTLGLVGGREDSTEPPNLAAVLVGLPRLLLLPCLLAALLFGHAYSVRILACPSPSDYLHKVADVSEVFRIALGPGASFAALSLRSESRIARIDLQSEDMAVEYSDPGRFGVPDRGFPDRPMMLPGSTEELLYAPEPNRFYATAVAGEDMSSLDLEIGPGEEATNLVVTLSGDARQVEDATWIPGMCWINCMHWDQPQQSLLLGCEDRPGLHRYDPIEGTVTGSQLATELGDVQKVAFDPDPDADRMFTVSLWKQPTITELRRSDLAILRQSTIGGSHYDLAYDSASNSVFASSYYGSRVRVIDGETLQLKEVIPAGFGTRALALHTSRRLVLISSVYDGVVRLWDIDAGRLLAAIPVGGHVKYIAVDESGDRAWFWSQCGLYRLDFAELPQFSGDQGAAG